jgi:stage II sporulation protein D
VTKFLAAAIVTLLCACAGAAPTAQVGDEPDIRIGLLVGASEARITGQGSVGGVVGGSVAFRITGSQQAQLAPEGRAVRVSGPGAGRYERVTFVSLDRSQFVELNGKPYRGVVEAYVHDGALNVVNELSLEAYVAGVVNAELGRRAPHEQAAVEAQAIVTRTYALKNRGRFASEGYDLRATVTDQAYGGVAVESDRGWDAVRSTSGRVVVYRGELVSTFFHSTCGYSTASPDEVFRFGQRLPYLRPVSDRRQGGHYCDISPNFRWTVEWDAATLAGILRRTVPSRLGVEGVTVDELRDVRVQRTGPSGRVAEARIVVTRGEIPVFGPDIRAVFATPAGRSLGSTAFQIEVERRGGRVERITASGAGWGHGVGMCQWGAVGRARAGQDASTIVTTYFPGTTLERWY